MAQHSGLVPARYIHHVLGNHLPFFLPGLERGHSLAGSNLLARHSLLLRKLVVAILSVGVPLVSFSPTNVERRPANYASGRLMLNFYWH
jgi:hypothetical protein